MYVPDKNELPNVLSSIVKEGDIVVTMGAGDIWKFGEKFIEILKAKKSGVKS